MSLGQFLFSFEGRIGRAAFWLKFILPYTVITTVLFFIGGILSMPTAGDPGYGATAEMGTGQLVMTVVFIAYSLAALWCSLAVYAKRWHDRGKSGWWTLIALVPIIGGFWLLIECGFLKGTDGPNRFGADPVPMGGGTAPMPAE
ncbi:MAG: DUF805 domain-containing protein [Inquilinus sp.]|nr:DUF805 domain-containing protein [Inquilinus sp.]